MSTPNPPRGLEPRVTAVSTSRPSPEPRSTTKSFGPTPPSFRISSTMTHGVGTYGPALSRFTFLGGRDGREDARTGATSG